MNKSQLVDALAERLGDRRAAATAVDGLLETIMSTVGAGESVSLTGFGVFESRARAARLARNPRTGEAVEVVATTVPAFRPGTGFRSAVRGTSAPRSARAAATPAPPEVAEPVAEPVAESPKSGKGKKAAKAASFAGDAKPAKPKKGKVKSDAGPGARKDGGKKGGGKKDDGGKGRKAKSKK